MCKFLADRLISTVLISDKKGRLCWSNDKLGVFSIKKCSELLILEDESDINFDCGKVWNIKVPPRVRSFLWMLAIDRIPTKDFLAKRGVNLQHL